MLTLQEKIAFIIFGNFLRKRYIVTFFLFFGVALFASISGTFNVAVVAMEESGDFNWSPSEKGVVLSAMYYGFIVTQIPGGLLVRHFPSTIIFGVGIASACVLTFLTPFVAKNLSLLVTLKIMEGLFLGVMYPAEITIVKNWASPLQRTCMMLLISAGNYFGPVISQPLAGILSDNFGWESVFYSVGGVGCIWFIFYIFIVKESPESDNLIGCNENSDILSVQSDNKCDKTIPWKSILTSIPFWGIIVANFTLSWGLYTIAIQLPTYLNDMNPELAMKMTGFYSMLPSLTTGVMSPVAGWIVGVIHKREWLTTLQVRRYFTCVAFVLQSIFLLLTAFVMESHATLTFLSISEGLAAFALCGYGVNYLDIAPQFCGLLLGISLTFGTIAGILSPLLAGVIVRDKVSHV